MTWLLVFVLIVAVSGAVVTGCSDDSTSNIATTAGLEAASSDTEVWGGNGSSNNCAEGGTYHWILTAGGQGFSLTSATLHVTYVGGGTGQTRWLLPGARLRGYALRYHRW